MKELEFDGVIDDLMAWKIFLVKRKANQNVERRVLDRVKWRSMWRTNIARLQIEQLGVKFPFLVARPLFVLGILRRFFANEKRLGDILLLIRNLAENWYPASPYYHIAEINALWAFFCIFNPFGMEAFIASRISLCWILCSKVTTEISHEN